MSIKIKAQAKKNPQDLNAAPKFYAQVVKQGETTLDSLSHLIAQMSTVSRTDVYAVLMGLVEVIPQELSQGKTVRMGKLGSYSISVNSHPAETADKVSAASVKKVKLNFRPSQELKLEVAKFTVQKITVE